MSPVPEPPHLLLPLRARGPLISEPPRIGDWPVAVQSAELLRGTIVRCGPGFRAASWPENRITRITALSPWLENDRFIASHATAAWVWGTLRTTPTREVDVLLRGGRIGEHRKRALGRYRNARISDEEIAHIGGFRLTRPARTAYDLLREERFPPAEIRAAIRMLATAPGARRRLAERTLRAPPNLRSRVQQRFARVFHLSAFAAADQFVTR